MEAVVGARKKNDKRNWAEDGKKINQSLVFLMFYEHHAYFTLCRYLVSIIAVNYDLLDLNPMV